MIAMCVIFAYYQDALFYALSFAGLHGDFYSLTYFVPLVVFCFFSFGGLVFSFCSPYNNWSLALWLVLLRFFRSLQFAMNGCPVAWICADGTVFSVFDRSFSQGVMGGLFYSYHLYV